jgi:UDP-2-acetamido-3-amino-2,3-dideoxy-glucuronate N-acetyltransferase
VVTRDVPDFALVVGAPARIAGWVCACGVTLVKTSVPPATMTCTGCGARYLAADEETGSKIRPE